MTSTTFKDHFSGNSGEYRKYRPSYPKELFQFLASLSPSTTVAWDCATGSGQAAVKLAQYFSSVIATDASIEQAQNAKPTENVVYEVAQAENAPILSGSIDLITVAQALHWFNAELFFSEAKRVLKNGGIIAVWSYNLLSLTPELDEIIKEFYQSIVGAYWPAERKHIESGYKNILFPFPQVSVPHFSMSAEWTLEELKGYLSTWSAVKRYMENKGSNPIDVIANKLFEKWGAQPKLQKVTWPLSLIIGKNST